MHLTGKSGLPPRVMLAVVTCAVCSGKHASHSPPPFPTFIQSSLPRLHQPSSTSPPPSFHLSSITSSQVPANWPQPSHPHIPPPPTHTSDPLVLPPRPRSRPHHQRLHRRLDTSRHRPLLSPRRKSRPHAPEHELRVRRLCGLRDHQPAVVRRAWAQGL